MCDFPDYAASYAHRLGCRCIRCNDWNTKKQARLLRRARAMVIDGPFCSFPDLSPCTGYQYGCRCGRCMAANRARFNRWAKKKKRKPPAQ